MRRHIPKESKEIALKMSLDDHLTDDEIFQKTGITPRTLRRLRQTYQQTGKVVRVPEVQGRPPMLSVTDVDFLKGCIERKPDVTLKELQVVLAEVRGTSTSLSTIFRALKRQGFAKTKQVTSSQAPKTSLSEKQPST